MNRSYYPFIAITDFGPYITKLILCLPCGVRAEDGSDPGDFMTGELQVHCRIRQQLRCRKVCQFEYE